MSLEAVTHAQTQRDEHHARAEEASQAFARAIHEAREAGASWKHLQDATGLSRQRLWQITNGK